MKIRTTLLACSLALAGCAARDTAASADRPLLSVETRLSCAIDEAPAETVTRGPRRSYDGEAVPSAPAPASADTDLDGVTPRRACEAGERLAALMLAVPAITAAVDGDGTVALIEAAEPLAAARAAPPPRIQVAPTPANRAAEAAARAAAGAQGRARQAR